MTEDQEQEHDTVATRREFGGINPADDLTSKRPIWALCHEVSIHYTVLAQVISCAGNVRFGLQFQPDDLGPLVLFSGLGVVVTVTFRLITRIPIK